MRTVTAFEARRTAGRVFSGEMTKLSDSPPRGAIGAGLFLLVSAFLLAAGAIPPAADRSSDGPGEIGAFVLDPAVTPVQG